MSGPHTARRWALAAGAGGALVLADQLRRRPGVRRAVSRQLRLLRTGGRVGARVAVAKAATPFVSEERAEQLRAEVELQGARDVAETLGHMKGAMMKLGQMAAYIDQGLPEPIREVLSGLQADAPPMAPEAARKVVRSDFGRPVEELFAEWDDEPLAAASIGQVHRARLHDGRLVAVKVQYPGIDEVIRADLVSVDALFSTMGLVFSGLDAKVLIAELKARLAEELDYGLEAENQRFFAEQYRGHPTVHIPEVVDELCSAHVLTTELADGVRWSEALTWDQHQRDLIGETLYRFAFDGIYRLHAFNGDPHPGNYLFHGDGRVTFLDFGLVKRFAADEVDQFSVMIRHMLAGDTAAYRATVESIGLLKPGLDVTDEQVVEYFGHFYEHVMVDRPLTIEPEWSSESMRRYFDVSGPFAELIKAANLPASMVLVQRINLGLFALLGELHATANWRRIAEEIWPDVDGAPSTPMGIAIAAWKADRDRLSHLTHGADQ